MSWAVLFHDAFDAGVKDLYQAARIIVTDKRFDEFLASLATAK